MKSSDVWFTLYYGNKTMSDNGKIKTIIKNDSGEMRLTGHDKGIMYYKDVLHQMLDIAIDKIAKENP